MLLWNMVIDSYLYKWAVKRKFLLIPLCSVFRLRPYSHPLVRLFPVNKIKNNFDQKGLLTDVKIKIRVWLFVIRIYLYIIGSVEVKTQTLRQAKHLTVCIILS